MAFDGSNGIESGVAPARTVQISLRKIGSFAFVESVEGDIPRLRYTGIQEPRRTL